MVVGVDVHPVEGPDAVEREHQVQGLAVHLLLPAEPVVAWKKCIECLVRNLPKNKKDSFRLYRLN